VYSVGTWGMDLAGWFMKANIRRDNVFLGRKCITLSEKSTPGGVPEDPSQS
jgi:hypothetical protein